MIPRVTSGADERLDAIVRAIVDGVHPTRVILFGSRARGGAREDSDYDVVVELPFDRDQYYETYSRVSAAARHGATDTSVDVLVRAPGEIEAKCDDPGFMDWEIARDGIVLYPPDASSEALRPSAARPRRVRERTPFESIKFWMERVQEDLWVVQRALETGESAAWGAAGFHAQQAAEKYLKILMVQAGAHPPEIHELDKLIIELRTLGYDFPAFAAECKLLNPYAVTIRHPEQAPLPDEAGGRDVIAAAQSIIDAAKGFIDN